MENRDEKLWQIAKKRAGFKKQLGTYIVVNIFLWAIWWFKISPDNNYDSGIPWPAWVTLGWGFGIAWSYYKAYHDNGESDTMREYQKLKDKEGK